MSINSLLESQNIIQHNHLRNICLGSKKLKRSNEIQSRDDAFPREDIPDLSISNYQASDKINLALSFDKTVKDLELTGLLTAALASQHKNTRMAAWDTVCSKYPSISAIARMLQSQIEQEINHKINEANRKRPSMRGSDIFYAGDYAANDFPMIEQILITDKLLVDTLMKEHLIKDGELNQNLIFFCKFALERVMSQLQITQSMDFISTIRPLIPLEVRAIQGDLDALYEMGLLDVAIKIMKQSQQRSSKTNQENKDPGQKKSILSAPKELDKRLETQIFNGLSKSDLLCNELAKATNYKRALLIINALGLHGDLNSIQAIQQIKHGNINEKGHWLVFGQRHDEADLKNRCNDAIKKIRARFETN